jgi:hypothetical protein
MVKKLPFAIILKSQYNERMIGRILTISALLFGFTGILNSAQAEQNTLPLDCQYSCGCQECCAKKGINCEPLAGKSSSSDSSGNPAPAANTNFGGDAR